MTNFDHAVEAAIGIREMALEAARLLAPGGIGFRASRRAIARPVDYMRYAEFDAVLTDIRFEPNTTCLDISSPQWLSLFLARKHPAVQFFYINIIDIEINPFVEIAKALGISNLKYCKQDVRQMQFPDQTFDWAISVSVIEHVYPERDGDLQALTEIKRVLKRGGVFHLTVPFKAVRNVVYQDGPVYERNEQSRNFFAREYDQESFDDLINLSGFKKRGTKYITERVGPFALDYFEWGPGRNFSIARLVVKLLRRLEGLAGNSFDRALARRYLMVSPERASRLVNIFVALQR